MLHTHDILRSRIYAQKGLHEVTKLDRPATAIYEELAQSEWSNDFETKMRNRLIMGGLRYGRMRGQKKKQYDYIKSLHKRLSQYELTGNTEYLVDVANLALLEYEVGQHPNKHWADVHEEHCATAL
jgi:hypothetical protein